MGKENFLVLPLLISGDKYINKVRASRIAKDGDLSTPLYSESENKIVKFFEIIYSSWTLGCRGYLHSYDDTSEIMLLKRQLIINEVSLKRQLFILLA